MCKQAASNNTNRWKRQAAKVNKEGNKCNIESKAVRKKGVIEPASNYISKKIRDEIEVEFGTTILVLVKVGMT